MCDRGLNTLLYWKTPWKAYDVKGSPKDSRWIISHSSGRVRYNWREQQSIENTGDFAQKNGYQLLPIFNENGRWMNEWMNEWWYSVYLNISFFRRRLLGNHRRFFHLCSCHHLPLLLSPRLPLLLEYELTSETVHSLLSHFYRVTR